MRLGRAASEILIYHEFGGEMPPNVSATNGLRLRAVPERIAQAVPPCVPSVIRRELREALGAYGFVFVYDSGCAMLNGIRKGRGFTVIESLGCAALALAKGEAVSSFPATAARASSSCGRTAQPATATEASRPVAAAKAHPTT